MSLSTLKSASVPYLFDGTLYTEFKLNYIDEARSFGGPFVVALASGTIFIRPEIDGEATITVSGIQLRRYEKNEAGEFTSTAKKQLLTDALARERLILEDGVICARWVSLLFSRITAHVRSTLATDRVTYDSAVTGNDIFALFKIADAAYLTGNGVAICQNLVSLLTLRQGTMPYEELLEIFYRRMQQVLRDFKDSDHDGFINADHLMAAIFVQAVDNVYFSSVVNEHHLKFPGGKTGKIETVTALFNKFHQAKKAQVPQPLASVPGDSTVDTSDAPPSKALAGKAKNINEDPAPKQCSTCKKTFTGRYGKYCSSCSREYNARREKAKDSYDSGDSVALARGRFSSGRYMQDDGTSSDDENRAL
jgi:hypothetical protein